MGNKFSRLELGKIGLVQETEDGRIIQIGLRPEQSEMLQNFLAIISKESPLVQMGEDYELMLKSELFECRNVACREMTNRDNGTVFCDKHKPYLGI